MRTCFYTFFAWLVFTLASAEARDSKIDKARYKDAFWDVLASLELLRVECASSSLNHCGTRASIYVQRVKTRYQTIDHRFPAHQELKDAIAVIERGVTDQINGKDIVALSTAFERRLLGQLDAVPLPAESLNLEIGQSRYMEHCAACHGGSGRGEGPLASKLKNPVRSFAASFRPSALTPLSTYAVMISGSAGTEMTSFVEAMSQDEMWSVAFYVSALPYVTQSSRITNACMKEVFKILDLNQLMTLTDTELIPIAKKLEGCEIDVASLRTIGTFDPRLAREINGELAARGSKSARGLVVLSLAIALVSGIFVWILTRRARIK